jgi:hypothetical protein
LIRNVLRRSAIALAALAAVAAVAVPAVSASASAAAPAKRAARIVAAPGSNCHNPIQIESFTLTDPQLSWDWSGSNVVESTGFTVLCQIPGTVDGTSVEQYRFWCTSICAMQSGLMSIVGTPCNGGDTAAYWIAAGADDTYVHDLRRHRRGRAGQRCREQHHVPAQGHGRRPQSWGECTSPGNC